MKKIFYFAAAIVFLTACSNSQPQQNQATDSSANSQTSAADMHEGHDHGAGEATHSDTVAIRQGQRVYFKNLANGQPFKLPFIVEFGVDGMAVEPAQGVNPDKGHHHLIIDNAGVKAGEMVPMGKESEGYYHYGKGQMRDTLTIKKFPMLKPGKHTLRLQFANGLHQSYGPAMSASVDIVVMP